MSLQPCLGISIPTTGSRLRGWGAASEWGLVAPEGRLSPQYEKILKLTADARFGEYPTESADLWTTLGPRPGAGTEAPPPSSPP